MDEAIGGGVDPERFTETNRLLQPPAEQIVVGAQVTPRQHPDGDLGTVAEQRVAEHPAPGAAHAHDLAGGGPHFPDVGAVHPRMARVNAIFSALVDSDRRHHASSCPPAPSGYNS